MVTGRKSLTLFRRLGLGIRHGTCRLGTELLDDRNRGGDRLRCPVELQPGDVGVVARVSGYEREPVLHRGGSNQDVEGSLVHLAFPTTQIEPDIGRPVRDLLAELQNRNSSKKCAEALGKR